MGPFLGDEWEEALQEHEAACRTFQALWQRLFPKSTRSHETPKRHLLWNYAPKQIRFTKCSLGLYSDTGVRNDAPRVRQTLAAMEKSRALAPKSSRERTCSFRRDARRGNAAEAKCLTPGCPRRQRRRRRRNKRRRRKRRKRLVKPSFGDGMKVEKARLQRYRAVRAWNAERLPSDRESMRRQAIAIAIHEGKGGEFLVDGQKPWNVY